MKNEYWFRHFLICCMNATRHQGIELQNYALLIQEEENGRFGNEQMTRHFHAADENICILTADDPGYWRECLDFEKLCELTTDEIREYYNEYCIQRLKIELCEE